MSAVDVAVKQIRCDQCGTLSDPGPTASGLRATLATSGWTSGYGPLTPIPKSPFGDTYLEAPTVDYCPTCSTERTT